MYTVNGIKVYRKVVWNKRNINPWLTRWLEERTHSNLQKLELLVAEPFTRWKLVGITDTQLTLAPSSERSLFYYIRPSLEYLFGEELIGVCKKVGEDDLILDFKSPSTLFKKLTKEDLEEAEKRSWHPGEKWSKKEHQGIRKIF